MAKQDIKGLDTLRFAAALCVAFSHGLLPFGDVFGREGSLGAAAGRLWYVLFNGPAAVLIFFVVSGFCIHYAFACGTPFRTVPFFLRRCIRISIPLFAAKLLGYFLGPAAQGALALVLWSIYCEIIYYALYPLLRGLFSKIGLTPLVAVSFLAASAVIVWRWDVRYYWEFGIGLTCIVGLPAWLLGCLLAQRLAEGRGVKIGVSRQSIWRWRLAIWGYMATSMLVFYHAPWRLGYPALLLPFYILCYFWLFSEIAYWRTRPTIPILEWAGEWSYSLYLVHNMIIALVPASAERPILSFAIKPLLTLMAVLLFYALIEWPSHNLACDFSRRASSYLQARRRVTIPLP